MTQSRLLDLLRTASPAHQIMKLPDIDLGLADIEPFPFLAIIGQEEMKLALTLSIINPNVGGALLIGSRGTAKTTAARALTDLLPSARRSLCSNGCTETMLDEGGMDAICKACAAKVGYGQPLTVEERVRIFELPLNSRLEDVVGNINERIAMEQQRVRLDRGILAQADGHILYIDEVNLLENDVANAILDAAAQGFYIVRRGPMNMRYRSRFQLIGSMNPEEGRLRPQLMDRFGLRALVQGLPSVAERYAAYQQAIIYRQSPDSLAAAYADQTMLLAGEIEQARQRLQTVTVSVEAQNLGLYLIQSLGIDSNRAEITLFEAARAHAAADERPEAAVADIHAVALMSLRMRSSGPLRDFFNDQQEEDDRLRELVAKR